MAGGYIGKLLVVNLSTGAIDPETPEEKLYRDFIGGYGLGARILYSNQKGGVDPLGPENTLGIVTGPLTGTPATMAANRPNVPAFAVWVWTMSGFSFFITDSIRVGNF